jgi:hypothetical protein
MISSVDVAHSFTEFTVDNSILFYKKIPPPQQDPRTNHKIAAMFAEI